MTQACSQMEFLLQDAGVQLRARAAKALQESMQLAGEERARAEGRAAAYRDALALLAQQAELFGLSAEQLGLEDHG